MSVTHLAAALIVIFLVFAVAVTVKLFYVHWQRRSFNRRTSHPPSSIRRSSNRSPEFPTDEAAATKELLYFFCLKPNLHHDISSKKNTDLLSPEDDQVVDVFKMLEANGPAKFLCTIKEEDKDDVQESKPDVDFPTKPDVCLPMSCVQLAEENVTEVEAEEEEVVVTVDGGDGDGDVMKTEFSTPCDSPSFFTPAGSPSRDFMETKFAVTVDVTGNIDEMIGGCR